MPGHTRPGMTRAVFLMRRNSPLRFWLSISGIAAAVVLAAAGGLLL
jgi:hypothetical protein